MNSTSNSEVKEILTGERCVLLAKYTLFIGKCRKRKPHRERGGLPKRLEVACLLALALVPSHLPFIQDSHGIQ